MANIKIFLLMVVLLVPLFGIIIPQEKQTYPFAECD